MMLSSLAVVTTMVAGLNYELLLSSGCVCEGVREYETMHEHLKEGPSQLFGDHVRSSAYICALLQDYCTLYTINSGY